MAFEWDEDKGQRNLAKHGIDFADVQALFDGRPVVEAPSQPTGEPRFVTTGIVDGQFYTVDWTKRDGNTRLISARRARDGEEREYRSVYGG